MEFLDVRTDFAFKKVFGSTDGRSSLISFLNSVIDFDGKCVITDLDIVDSHNLPQLKGMKDTFIDVNAVLSDHTTVIIKTQILNHPGLESPILYDAAKNHSIQLLKGQRFDLIKPVIAVTIIANFEIFKDDVEAINYFKVINKKGFTDYPNDIDLIFIELSKFNKTQEQCQSLQDDWLFFLKNSEEQTIAPPELTAPLVMAYEACNEDRMSKNDLEIQYNKKQYIAIQVGSLELARRQGFEKGFKDGIQEAETLKIARRMKEYDIDLEVISKATGLTFNQLNNLD